MATYTSNYGWTKPSGSDNVDISVLNDNLDDQDRTIHDAFLNMAPPFSESSTYAVDDIVLYGTGLYKCHTAVVTPGSWTGSTNWQVYKLSEGGSGGGGSSLTAGDYIEIDENDKINVKLQKGDYTEYRLTGAYSPVNQLTIEKYRDGVLVSTESYRNDASYTPIAIDGLFEIWYTASSPRYYWHYKLLEDSQEHSAGYEDSWYYTDTATRTETFNVDDESAELVTKGDLGTASSKDVSASGDASSSQVVMGNDSRLTDSRPASDVSAWAKQSTKPTYTASEVGAIATTQKGVASGVAELDANGKVPSSQLPSYPASKVIMTGGGNVEDAVVKASAYLAGDKYTINSQSLLEFPARIGWSRTKVVVTFFLSKEIKASSAVVSNKPSSITIYTKDEARVCNITESTIINMTNNMICVLFNITPTTAWTQTGDAICVFELLAGAGTQTIEFTFA